MLRYQSPTYDDRKGCTSRWFLIDVMDDGIYLQNHHSRSLFHNGRLLDMLRFQCRGDARQN